jgi:hypothetical protein
MENGRVIARRIPALSTLFAFSLLAQAPPPPADRTVPPLGRAVVSEGVADLYERPDETSPVEDQAVLGETADVLEETAGFARVRTEDGNVAWVPERSIRREVPPAGRLVEVTSPWAHVYDTPDFTRSRPLLTAPLGARLLVEDELAREGHVWLRVRLPDGRRAFLAKDDAAPAAPGLRAKDLDPAHRIALGTRFLGARYTWGGTTPLKEGEVQEGVRGRVHRGGRFAATIPPATPAAGRRRRGS